ncbi:pyridine nucleotide-disulfide oxidoreductase [Methylobacterium sp. Leaf111]|uniref:dihydrolipoyl dehydrogenase n=1 Tax=Methylobacterium sp. Leaf111 TaxID=1736257 RepID=UPI0006F229EC|nr:dihydrolipoyl dehydrogenase [Methylobacterium sp. Leaf111]KQP76474.1 pyridine nucleotide-disulfide oxidoreductase [Methylobacterium sp. Leaf111]
MRERSCDIAVIGAGTAGLAALRAARDRDADAVLIEAGPGGTTCARVGCMPSKLLITAANAAHAARHADVFGIDAGSVRVDGPRVMARVRRERDRFVAGVRAGVDELPAEIRIAGRARFTGPDTLAVDDHTALRFRAAIVATGSSPAVPEPLRDLGDRLLTSDTVFEIPDLPESLAVLGGGAVGLELAQAMARLGVAVTLFDPGTHLASLRDDGLAETARRLFGAEMTLRLGCRVTEGDRAPEGVRLTWTDAAGATGTGTFARVLAAAGRPPNVRHLGLEAAGLSLDEHGMPAFDARSLLCAGGPVFLAGDANADRPVLHEAARQGRIAGANAARLVASGRHAVEAPRRWTNLAMVFTEPQTASVGAPYDPADATLVRGSVDFGDQGRARIMAENAGALHLYADRSGTLRGAEMLGPACEHLAQFLALAIADGLTAEALLDRPIYHPTVEEGLKTALEAIVAALDR